MSKAALDYLRLATWDTVEHTYLLADCLIDNKGEWEQSRWLQYHGWKSDSFFIGTGQQKNTRHSVVNISGPNADYHFGALTTIDAYYCTRIDIQITIPTNEHLNLPWIYDQLRNQEIKCSIIQSELNDTLYVGARTSDVFTRLYEKPLDEMYLRLEFEFKGKAARGIWKALQSDSTVDEVFQHYLKKSKLPEWVKKFYFEAQDGETQFAIRKEIEKTDMKKLDWLQSCDECVRQAMYNHNIGTAVRELVMSWANEAANVDIIKEID